MAWTPSSQNEHLVEPMQISPEPSARIHHNYSPMCVRPDSPTKSLASAFLDLATSPGETRQHLHTASLYDSRTIPAQSSPAGRRVSTPGRYSVIGNNNRYSPASTSIPHADTRAPHTDSKQGKVRVGRSLVLGKKAGEDGTSISHMKKEIMFESEAHGDDVHKGMADDKPENEKRSHCNCFRVLMGLAVLLTVASVLAVHLDTRLTGRCSREDDLNMTDIKIALAKRVFGQHIAVEQVVKSLEDFLGADMADMPLVLSFHGWTGIGKNHISNIIAEHLPDTCVQRIIIPLHFPHNGPEYTNGKRLHDRIIQHSSSSTCCLTLFVVDDVEKADTDMVTGLKMAIHNITNMSRQSEQPSTVIVLLLSDTAGTAINRYLLKWIEDGNRREAVTVEDVVSVLDSLPADNWMRDMNEEGLITQLVPFLPLEREHVYQCLLRYTSSINQDTQSQHVRVQQALDSLSYLPENTNLFSKSGCKKISNQFDLAQDMNEDHTHV